MDQIEASHPDWVNARKAPLQNWIVFPTGLRGAHYSAEFTGDGHLVTGISLNARDEAVNLKRYMLLQEHSAALSAAFNLPVDWIGPHSPGRDSIFKRQHLPTLRIVARGKNS